MATESPTKLREEAGVLYTRAREILDSTEEFDPAKSEEADQLMDKADELIERATGLEKNDDRRARIDKALSNRQEREKEEEEEGNEQRGRRETRDERDEREERMRILDKWVRNGRSELNPEERRTLVEGTDTQGGYLVPEDMRREIVKELPAFTIMRPLARVTSTGRDMVSYPRLTGATGSDQDIYTSAVQVVWADETYTDDEGLTEPTFGQERVEVNKMLAKTRLSVDLLNDADADVLGLLNTLYAEAFGLGEDQAFVNGNGVGRPRGIFQVGTIPTVNSGHATQLTADGLIDLVYALPPQYRNRGQFFCRSNTERDVRKFKDGNGQYLWQPGLQQGQPATLLGYGINSTEFAPAIAASATPIAFGDPMTYWIWDRTGMTMQRLDERYAEQGLVGFVATRRLAGDLVQERAWRTQTVSA